MKVYVGPNFPVVARYEVKGKDDVYFRGNESDLAKVNGPGVPGKKNRVRIVGNAVGGLPGAALCGRGSG